MKIVHARTHRSTATYLAVLVAFLAGTGCELAPASPTLPNRDRPPVTMNVFPGTIETSRSFSGATNYWYQVCSEITIPVRGVRISMSEMEFIPFGADGTRYPPQGVIGGYSIEPGTTSSRCWGFQEFNSTHGPATTYRLRFTYYTDATPALLSVEASSSLTMIPSRF